MFMAGPPVSEVVGEVRSKGSRLAPHQIVGHIAPWAPVPTLQAVGLASLISGGVPSRQDDVTTINNEALRDRIVAMGGLGLSPQQLATLPSYGAYNDGRGDLITLAAQQELDRATLTALYGYAGFEASILCPCGNSGLPSLDAMNDERYRQHSLELRLESSVGNSIDYLAGLFY
jgi:hypothetical protein